MSTTPFSVTIGGLPEATQLDGEELIEIEQGGLSHAERPALRCRSNCDWLQAICGWCG